MHSSPARRHRRFVLPAVAAAAALVATGAWVTSGGGTSTAPAAFEANGPAPAGVAPATGRNADTSAADRSNRLVLIPPAVKLHPAPSPTKHRPAPMSNSPRRPRMPAPTTHSAPPPAPPASSDPAPTPGGGGVTAQVVTLTNAERAKAGCGPLTVNGTLAQVAQAHSQDMATNNYFDHNSQDGRSPFDRMTAAGYQFSTAAENIAAGQRTPQDVMTSWMNSPGHRANILNCSLHQIGVGYATVSSSEYGVYWTQDFGTPR
jgi:uncharacterized protein YkwD